MADSGWWYSFVAASPIPETGEAVNVAIVIGNGAVDQVAFSPGLPRLGGLAPFTERKAFEEILRAMSEQARTGLALSELAATLAPQLCIGPQRVLRYAPDQPIVDALVRRYLRGPGFGPEHEEKRLVLRSRRELDNALSRVANVRAMQEILPRPDATTLYPEVHAFQESRVPRLGRAVRGPHRDLLLDAVLLEPGRTSLAIRSATERIGRAFWYYDKHRRQVASQAHREFRLVGLVVTEEETREVKDARDYIEENWAKHAVVVKAEFGGPAPGLRANVEWLANGAV